MALKCPHAFSTLWPSSWNHASRRCQFPHLDRLVKTAANEISAIRSKCDGVNTISVAVWVLKSLDEISGCSVPNTHTLIQRAGSNKAAVGRYGNGGHTIFNAEDQLLLAIHNVPQADSLVATARSNITSIASKIERVDILLVAREDVFNCTGSNVPNL
jgi:hypothetical protein